MTSRATETCENFADNPAFAAALGACPTVDASSLAEAIEADGRRRLSEGQSVTLARYLDAIPNLQNNADALDAAIDVSLRALAGSSHVTESAIEALVQAHPALAVSIREAAALNKAVWSTTDVRLRLGSSPTKPLPHEFGPLLPTGEHRYVLLELRGKGSFGHVYKARDRQLSERGHEAVVAIKILVAPDRTRLSRQRLFDEATKARRISHSNVVQVLDRGTSDDDEDFIVYEYVDGGDLSRQSPTAMPMKPRQAAALMGKIARGVHAAHGAGLIHCDLKPSNIMLTAAGEPKVADFGIAVRLDEREAPLAGVHESGGGAPVGNIAFISPEQFRGEERGFSVPSDLYALGGILWHLLTGELPNGATREEIAAHHHKAAASRQLHRFASRIDADLQAVCERALAPDPADRFDSAAAFADDLELWLGHEPVSSRAPSLVHRVMLWIRRKPALALSTAAIVLLAVIGAATAMHFASLARARARDAAEAAFEIRVRENVEALKQQLGGRVISALATIGDRERFVTDSMMQMWALEYVYGPSILGTPELVNEVWERRFETARKVIADRRERGLGEAAETLLWEQVLAFWLVSRGDFQEVMPLLDHAIQYWTPRLPADDPWLLDLNAVKLCAQVNALQIGGINANAPEAGRTAGEINGMNAEHRSHAQALHEQLADIAAHLEEQRPRTAIHFLALRSLMTLDSPSLLNDAARAERTQLHYQSLLDASQQKATGVTDDVKRTNKAVERERRRPPKD